MKCLVTLLKEPVINFYCSGKLWPVKSKSHKTTTKYWALGQTGHINCTYGTWHKGSSPSSWHNNANWNEQQDSRGTNLSLSGNRFDLDLYKDVYYNSSCFPFVSICATEREMAETFRVHSRKWNIYIGECIPLSSKAPIWKSFIVLFAWFWWQTEIGIY